MISIIPFSRQRKTERERRYIARFRAATILAASGNQGPARLTRAERRTAERAARKADRRLYGRARPEPVDVVADPPAHLGRRKGDGTSDREILAAMKRLFRVSERYAGRRPKLLGVAP